MLPLKLISNFTKKIKTFQAPQQVKTYAQNLIEGLISDTISQAVSEDEGCSKPNDDEDKAANEETDISLSLATEEPETEIKPSDDNNIVVKSPSSHVETDSLDESEHAGQNN